MTRFSHLDRLGTSSRTTDAGANVVDSKRYDAFGLPTSFSNPSNSQAGFASAFGIQEDSETGLKLMGHRYYDPGTGRFITRDPAQDGPNWYAYCDNNPLAAVDPTGLTLRTVRDTDKDANGRGFTKDEYDQIQKDIAELRKTKRGRYILEKLEKDGIDHRIEKGLGSEDPYTPDFKDVRLRPDKKYLIAVDSLGSGHAAFGGARLLAHELGHVATKTKDDGTAMMNSINQNENPVAKELGLLRRTSYSWWIYDPATKKYYDPAYPNQPGFRWP